MQLEEFVNVRGFLLLQVVSETDVQNTGRRLRLQLFESPTHFHSRSDTVDVSVCSHVCYMMMKWCVL